MRKELAIAVVATFCLTAVLFTVLPIRELLGLEGETTNPSDTDSAKQPEPKTIVVCQNSNITTSNASIPNAFVEGYRYVSIFVAYSRPFPDEAAVVCCPSCSNITGRTDGMGNAYYTELKLHGYTSSGSVVSTNVMLGAPYLYFIAEIPNESVELTIAVYCYN